MAGTNADKAKETKKTELKRIFIPKLAGSKNQPPLEGSVNGKSFLLPRGQEHEVPADVYEVVDRSLKAEDAADNYYNSIQKQLLDRSKEEADLI